MYCKIMTINLVNTYQHLVLYVYSDFFQVFGSVFLSRNLPSWLAYTCSKYFLIIQFYFYKVYNNDPSLIPDFSNLKFFFVKNIKLLKYCQFCGSFKESIFVFVHFFLFLFSNPYYFLFLFALDLICSSFFYVLKVEN